MKILVTGAAGFTGQFFQVAAQHVGHEIVTLQANLTNKAAVASEVATLVPDAVVHLAAISFVGHADDTEFYSVNVIGTTNLLAALADLNKPFKKVLLASSANVYGNSESSPITESQAPAPVNHYAMSKLAMELMARTYMDRLPIVITRPFNYVGPGQAPHFLIPKLVSHFARHAHYIELGNTHVEREFNDVRMVCDAYLALLKHGQPSEIYNVCSGRPYTLKHVIDTLSSLTGHVLETRINPTFVRENEVHRLCGDPAKLQSLVKESRTSLYQPDLRETLQWMLAETES